ncbi:hypothetical protein FQN54_004693 [Arachnomyces sp. PD_36]|nr:hypothetical protein FQN54_004693 [Arachnomyces sp. PD_36]
MPQSLPCDACSLRRVKCNGKNPCSTCVAREQPCTYLKIRKRRGPKGPRKSENAKIRAMQRDLGVMVSSMHAFTPSFNEHTEVPNQAGLSSCRQIPLPTYCTYIDIFQTRLYTVWPIVSANSLKERLSDPEAIDPEAYALGAALSAATLAQLRLPAHREAGQSTQVTSGDFVRECLRFRASFDYQDSASLDSLLTSIFLHMYYANVDRITLATFALRDAITYAHILNLGHRQTLDSLQPEQRQLRLRIYWILLVTERTFCMQHHPPIILQTIDYLPSPLEDGDSGSDLLTGFCNLVRLFTSIDGPLIQAPNSASITPSPTYSRARVREIQEGLQTGATTNPSIDEVQRVDIWITLAWLSSLLWQYSASHFMLTSEQSDAFFAPNFPFVIAKDFLSLVCRASIDSVRPHGYGMEIKLFQLANSLIDVLVYAPSLGKAYSTIDWGPRHAVVALEHLLDMVASGQSERLDKLHARMAQMNFTPTPRKALVEARRGETRDMLRDDLPVDGYATSCTADGGSNSQTEYESSEQISDDVSTIDNQKPDTFSDVGDPVRSTIQGEQGERLNSGVAESSADLGSEPSLLPQLATIIPQIRHNPGFSLDYGRVPSRSPERCAMGQNFLSEAPGIGH